MACVVEQIARRPTICFDADTALFDRLVSRFIDVRIAGLSVRRGRNGSSRSAVSMRFATPEVSVAAVFSVQDARFGASADWPLPWDAMDVSSISLSAQTIPCLSRRALKTAPHRPTLRAGKFPRPPCAASGASSRSLRSQIFPLAQRSFGGPPLAFRPPPCGGGGRRRFRGLLAPEPSQERFCGQPDQETRPWPSPSAPSPNPKTAASPAR